MTNEPDHLVVTSGSEPIKYMICDLNRLGSFHAATAQIQSI